MTGTDLPLAGVMVVEMTHMVMGPTCAGSWRSWREVIKVEPPAGDKTRSSRHGTSFFPLFNPRQRVSSRFQNVEDRETMDRLLASADVFLGNFRDGPIGQAGVGPDELRRKYPHLIVSGHKGFLSGPLRAPPGARRGVQMMSGLPP